MSRARRASTEDREGGERCAGKGGVGWAEDEVFGVVIQGGPRRDSERGYERGEVCCGGRLGARGVRGWVARMVSLVANLRTSDGNGEDGRRGCWAGKGLEEGWVGAGLVRLEIQLATAGLRWRRRRGGRHRVQRQDHSEKEKKWVSGEW